MSDLSKRRVVITGVGAISPLGLTATETWDGIKQGKSGISFIEHFDTNQSPTKFCGSVKNFDVAASGAMSAKDARKFDPFIQYGIAASVEAINQSGIIQSAPDLNRVGVMMGAGIGGMTVIEKTHQVYLEKGIKRITPFFVPGSIINMISGQLSIQYGFKGPNISIVTACTTGLHCIGQSARIIAYGDADVMIAGGAEKASTPLAMGGFSSAKALSTRNDSPQQASRPWDKDRDGFVLSDGGAALVIEEYEHAKARNAQILAEIVGFGMSSDAYHITAPPENGEGGALAMTNALNDAKVDPSQIGYINAHGTSTIVGDLAETRAVKTVFGNNASKVMVSSTKSMTGHMLGAAGAIETLFCVNALREQIIPATINLDNQGEGCDLDYVPHTAREHKIDYALCNSFGFGGTNGSILLKRI